MKELLNFKKQQELKISLIDAVELVKEGNIIAAENILNTTLKQKPLFFNKGLSFIDKEKLLDSLNIETETFPTGISFFDKKNIKPARKQLFTILASTGKGKSWFFVHIGKKCSFQGYNVLHITLEMGEKEIVNRYLQSFFSISAKNKKTKIPIFNKDELGRFVSLKNELLDNLNTLNDFSIKEILKVKLKKMTRKLNLVIKEFPTSSLTIPLLEAYLQNLEQFENFIPDILLLDYADLMKLDAKNLRIELGRLYTDLRGLAVEKNIALVTASQANREAEKAKLITKAHLAEDYSKAAICDTLISYNQTLMEEQCKLARLFVAKSRYTRGGSTCIITQNYETGQFCLDSVPMTNNNYWDSLQGEEE